MRKHHPDAWASYIQEKEERDSMAQSSKREQEDKNEMAETVRIFDVRNSGGRQSFLNLVRILHYV